MRGKLPYMYQYILRNGASNIKLPSIVVAELLVDVYKRNTDKAFMSISNFIKPFEIVPFDYACAQKYGECRAYLEQHGQTIGHNDYLIAATALANNAILVTHNTREFCRIPNLQIEDWCEMQL